MIWRKRTRCGTIVVSAIAIVSFAGELASADFDVNTPHGQETINHTSPNGTVELAIRSAAFPGHPEIYSQKDIDKEKELAGIDFYNGKTKDGLDIVLVPKTYSTSPGINRKSVV